MSKFETTKTLMYKFLLEEMKDDLHLAQQRARILISDNDYENAEFELKEIIRLKGNVSVLEELLQDSQKTTCNLPAIIEVSHINRFGTKNQNLTLESNQIDDSSFYHEPTGFLVKDWKELDEGVYYIVGNLLLLVENGELLSKYPQEAMWHPLADDLGVGGSMKLLAQERVYKHAQQIQ